MSSPTSEAKPNLVNLSDVIARLCGAEVLCIGDIMLDRYVWGAVERISPEAPIPVLRIERETAMLGGAGNVANNLAALGGGGTFIGVIGDDAPGREIADIMADLTTINAHLLTDTDRRSTIKTRFVGAHQQMMRADVESTQALPASLEVQILERLTHPSGTLGAIILSDYGKGVLSDTIVRGVIEYAHATATTVIIDPKGTDYSRYRGADIITPNKKELMDATGLPAHTDEQVIAACTHLMDTCGVGGVLATRSAEGMTLVLRGQEPHHLKAQAREVFDVSGAGDTVVATLALALASGADSLTAAYLANIAAGIVVAKSGTATVSAPELSRALHHQDLDLAEAKLTELERAAAQVRDWQTQGLSVGFTNGCFDLLHPGHISLLSQARKACDRLIVGLNSDSSVKTLKGPTRPVQSEAARAAVLGALSAIDLIVLFSAETPIELIQTLRPDVLVKGADYTVETVVGADIVQGYGGRVVLAELVDGHSTTRTIERMGK
ncbi:D-glycero-beta-D-manno-heptose-7-phosphate kinase [Magnetovibrio blakemorei]|uniref:Bifunctional protein HldE n=1 Tax=Magnetovibrio blakemorei TaxID=28181 RepID=A0A1E5Q6H7_9PROT|nr:D-glycero-beta-D-manno-heptose-7-phosphate kinase [Magnetovibrio blakemorei]OEJ66527.1 bifunctional heptose 7-phosphate kinase/heptose 1-phosphate adenyltransferase [Magnetovibrio blakemorei]